MSAFWRRACFALAGAAFSIPLLSTPANADRGDDELRPAAPAQSQAIEESTDEAPAPAPAGGEGAIFVPPPRRIDDITDVLDSYKRADAEGAERDRALADSVPPAELEGSALVEFHEERGLAAGRIGRVRQQIDDHTKAVELAHEGYYADKSRLLWELSVAESVAGSLADAIEHATKAIEAIPQNMVGRGIGYRSMLAIRRARTGDLERAWIELEKAERILEIARGWTAWGKWGGHWRSAVLIAKAYLLYTRGEYVEAEPFYQAAIQLVEENVDRYDDDPRINYRLYHEAILGEFARSLLRGANPVEAELRARRALTSSLNRTGRYTPDTAMALSYLIPTISEQGRHEEVESLARATLDIYDAIGAPADSYHRLRTRRWLAESLLAQGRWLEALAEYEATGAALAGDPRLLEGAFGHDLGWPLALDRVGRGEEAARLAQGALDRNARLLGPKHYNTAEASAVLAMALAATGDSEAARERFAESIPILLSRSRQATGEEVTQATRELRLRLILESYIGLLAALHGATDDAGARAGLAAEAFRLAEAARGRNVQRALAASSARAAVSDPALADLIRREQDAQKQIAALNGLLVNVMAAPDDQRDPGAITQLRTRIDGLRDARAALAEEIEAAFPEYAELLNPRLATIAEVQANLRAGEALIATYVGEDGSYVWAIPKAGPVAFTAAPISARDLDFQVAILRGEVDSGARTLEEVPAFDVALAYDLYASLLEPVKAGWWDAASLFFVAHGPLGYLPLSVLPAAPVAAVADAVPAFSGYRHVPWLARTHAVTVLPSVASLESLRALPPGDPNRRVLAGFGDPFFTFAQAEAAGGTGEALASRGVSGVELALREAPDTTDMSSAQLAILPRLPDTRAEVESIALALDADLSQDVFLGREANEERVKTMDLSDRRVLVFATHGLVPGDLDGLTQPALALSAPEVADVDGDGLLTMGEILGLELNADWVVLSACNTGSGDGAGAEAVSGLGRAFFYAGTRALLVSNWPVHSVSAKELTTDLFRRQGADPGLGRAESLRQAMLAVMDGPGYIDQGTGRTLFTYAHPMFWAPFSVVGDGG